MRRALPLLDPPGTEGVGGAGLGLVGQEGVAAYRCEGSEHRPAQGTRTARVLYPRSEVVDSFAMTTPYRPEPRFGDPLFLSTLR